MKKLILLLSVLFFTSCKTNKILSVVNNSTIQDTSIERVVCLTYSPGDTAIVLPYESFTFVDYGILHDTMSNSFDTLVYVNFVKNYCPVP